MARSKIPGIKQLKDGRWQARVTVGKDSKGKLIRKTRICDSHAAARQAKIDLQDEYNASLSDKADPTTLSEFIDRWLRDDIEPHLKSNTVASYKQQTSHHIKPMIGDLLLSEITPSTMNAFSAELRVREVPIPTQSYLLRVMSQICKRAMQLELIPRNPMSSVKRPRVVKKQIHPFTIDEVKSLLNHMSGMSLGAVYRLGICHGMRAGEIYGLHWDDIDFESSTLSISRNLVYGAGTGPMHMEAPKTRASNRTIELTERTLEELNLRRKIAIAEGHAANELVFCTITGKPVRPPTWWRDEWRPTLAELGIEHRGFHHARHTYATVAINEGVPIPVVSKVLGHANPKITLEIYAHALDEHQSKSVQAMQRLFG